MANLLDHLSRDSLPGEVMEAFIAWCTWEMARPALVLVLDTTGMHSFANDIRAADDYRHLADVSEAAGRAAHEARRRTGPLGLSTAEAASFLMQKLANAAGEANFDPEGVAFFAAQLVGWAAFAEKGFRNAEAKHAAEQQARQQQEARLEMLLNNRTE